MRLVLICALILVLPYSFYPERFWLNSVQPIEDQLSHGASTYIVPVSIDLAGHRVAIPDGATLWFKGGSLFNGEVSGSFYTKGVKKGSLSVVISKGSNLLSTFPVFNYTSTINASALSACSGGIVLKEDIDVDTDINLRCSIDGNWHTILASESPVSVLRISDSHKGITIKRIEIKRGYSGEINKNYALYCKNSSNITIEDSVIDGRLHFVNTTKPIDSSCISRGFDIRNSSLHCDLSSCPQGWQYGQDHLAFYSIQDVNISNCNIVSRNVNRVLKTSQYFVSNDYANVNHCTKNVLFNGNTVDAKSACGKQVWDMFCGTVNVSIIGNTFDVEGFTRVFENKAFQDKYENGDLLHSNILIIGNNINTRGADLFQFRTSQICDCFLISGNVFQMGGNNNNLHSGFVRSCGGYLQGYKLMVISNNSFVWKDEAVNLLFLKANFDCVETVIKDNKLEDVYRVNIGSASHPEKGPMKFQASSFEYHGNSKSYSEAFTKTREEIYVSDADINKMVIEMEDNLLNDSYEAIFADNVSMDHMLYSSRAIKTKSLIYKTKAAPWHNYKEKGRNR